MVWIPSLDARKTEMHQAKVVTWPGVSDNQTCLYMICMNPSLIL